MPTVGKPNFRRHSRQSAISFSRGDFAFRVRRDTNETDDPQERTKRWAEDANIEALTERNKREQREAELTQEREYIRRREKEEEEEGERRVAEEEYERIREKEKKKSKRARIVSNTSSIYSFLISATNPLHRQKLSVVTSEPYHASLDDRLSKLLLVHEALQQVWTFRQGLSITF